MRQDRVQLLDGGGPPGRAVVVRDEENLLVAAPPGAPRERRDDLVLELPPGERPRNGLDGTQPALAQADDDEAARG